VHRYFIRLSYNGTAFCGWQFQPNAPTVQEELNKKMSMLLREQIECVGCGRTDSGVHARKFYAHFDSVKDDLADNEKVIFRLNKILPDGIAIQQIYKMASDNAHARYSATWRSYEYHISRVKDPFGPDLSWELHEKLNMAAMNRGAKVLLEYKDFISFSKTGGNSKTTLCEVKKAGWHRTETGMYFTITANRFLRNMVRAIVGTLVDVGRGKITPEDVHRIIKSGKRSQAGTSVPAEGLYLTEIKYPVAFGLD
jgi:tRNA pseudouridine38-40 synthase